MTAVQYGERNFHAFYYMLAGMSSEEKSQWHLESSTKYAYLVSGTGGKKVKTATSDTNAYAAVKEALKSLGFKDKY